MVVRCVVNYLSVSKGKSKCSLLWQMHCPGVTPQDVKEIIAAHHDQMNRVQARAQLSSSIAQAITKRKFDAAHKPANFKVGDWMLMHVPAKNRLKPHYSGPYKCVAVSADNNFVTASHFANSEQVGPYSASRFIPFDFTRAEPEEVALFQLEEGQGVIGEIVGYRIADDGTDQFQIAWGYTDIVTWSTGANLKTVAKVIEYCKANNLPPPGSVRATKAVPVTEVAKQQRSKRTAAGPVERSRPRTAADPAVQPTTQNNQRKPNSRRHGTRR